MGVTYAATSRSQLVSNCYKLVIVDRLLGCTMLQFSLLFLEIIIVNVSRIIVVCFGD